MTIATDTLTQADKQEILAECRAIHALLCKVLAAVERTDHDAEGEAVIRVLPDSVHEADSIRTRYFVWLNSHKMSGPYHSKAMAETAAADLRTELLR